MRATAPKKGNRAMSRTHHMGSFFGGILQYPPPAADEIREALISSAEGRYQMGLIYGDHAWSGAGLKGAARQYGDRYAASRDHLIERANAKLLAGRSGMELGTALYEKRRILVARDAGGQVYRVLP